MTDTTQEITDLDGMETRDLREMWRRMYRKEPPARISRDLLIRAAAYQIQERQFGGLSKAAKKKIRSLTQRMGGEAGASPDPGTPLKPGAKLIREWRGKLHAVTALEDGFDYEGRRYGSLSKIACEITGAHRSGPHFFGLVREGKSV